MILKKTFGHIRFTLTVAKVTKVIGVDSTLDDGNHILMWDFDNTTLTEVEHHLKVTQDLLQLPEIRVVLTTLPGNYIAYCFKRTPWLKALWAVLGTGGVDPNFVKYSAYREHFTLRVTPKEIFVPQFAGVMSSKFEPDCTFRDLRHWVRYETLLK